MANEMNVCGVLAGAYRGKSEERGTWTHYEIPGTNDAYCGKVKEGNLCDQYGRVQDGTKPTCPHCLKKGDKNGVVPTTTDL